MLQSTDLKKMTITELTAESKSARRELFKIKLDVTSGQEKQIHLVKSHKKYIAKIETFLRQKQIIAQYKHTEVEESTGKDIKVKSKE